MGRFKNQVFFIAVFFWLIPFQALAGAWELSFGFNYSRSNYSDSNFAWSRRWGTSFGYHLTEFSEVQVSFQDIWNRTKITGFEDTTFHDRIYSVDWVQAFTGKSIPVQPYVKVGVGQLNRDATGSYGLGTLVPPSSLDSVTIILGAGLRIYFSKNFGLRGEATSYLTGGSVSTWKDNIAINVGFSLYF